MTTNKPAAPKAPESKPAETKSPEAAKPSDAEVQAQLDAALAEDQAAQKAADNAPDYDEVKAAHANALRHIEENEALGTSSKWTDQLSYEQGVEAAFAFVLGLGTGNEVDEEVLDDKGKPTGEFRKGARPGPNENPLPLSFHGLEQSEIDELTGVPSDSDDEADSASDSDQK